jgi:Ion channel
MPRNVREVIAQTWQTEANLSLFLALLLLLAFVLPSLGLERQDERLYGNLATTVMLISGVAIAWRRRVVFFVASFIAVATLIVRWATLLSPPHAPTIRSEIVTMAVILMLLYILLAQIFAPGPVTAMRIQGAIAVYLLFGFFWAHAYAAVASVVPGSFTLPGRDMSSVSEWFYYSFVTLTTVGFGDIVPTQAISRSLTVTEVLTGQLYLAILIGRLVGMQISSGPSTTDQRST